MEEEQSSLVKRYLFKITANIFGFLFTLVTIPIIARALGPKGYGDFYFLNIFFYQLIPLLTFSTSVGFFTKLSQRQHEFGLISFYFRIIFIAFIILFLFIFTVHSFGFDLKIWVGQNIIFVYLAAGYAALMWFIETLYQIADANGLTVRSEISKTIFKLIGMFCILVLYYNGVLEYKSFFLYQYFISFLSICALFFWVNKLGQTSLLSWRLSRETLIKYYNEFYLYSRPLFFYGLLGVLVNVFDRWMLQKYGGGIQQGFFSLSYQIGAVCLMFTSAMTTLITREFSISHFRNDKQKIAHLFRRYIPLLYSLSAFIACFTAVNADYVVSIFGGNDYQGAVLPMTIMALYPIHQTYGQLSGSVFYASGETKLYSTIGTIFMIIGIPITYLCIAPKNMLGLNVGALGLSIKMIGIQFFAANIQLFFNSRYLKLPFTKYLIHQIGCVLVLIILSVLSKYISYQLSFFLENQLISFIAAGFIYTIFVILTLIGYPKIFGLYKSDIFNFYIVLRKFKVGRV